MKKKYHVGDGIYVNGKWEFNEQVAANFDSHVKKSLPFYEEGHRMIIDILRNSLTSQKEYRILDIGCSTGILLEKISLSFPHHTLHMTGFDIEKSMIAVAGKRKFSQGHSVSFHVAGVKDFPFDKYHIVIAYYTLQFTNIKTRGAVLRKIYRSLLPGGLFFLFEKIKEKPYFENLFRILTIEYKLRQGYTREEILNKERSLKGVLIPVTKEKYYQLLKDAGFTSLSQIFQYGSFAGFLAKKSKNTRRET